MNPTFILAQPIWPAETQAPRHGFVGFFGQFALSSKQNLTLNLTGGTAYRVFVDGAFFHYGPARAAHGFYRVDTIPLSLEAGGHSLAIEVVHYGVPSYAWVEMDGFLQAELRSPDGVLLATLATGETSHQRDRTPLAFTARLLMEKYLRIDRFSMQRPFAEAYAMTQTTTAWRTTGISDPVSLALCPTKKLLPRRVGIPEFGILEAQRCVDTGTLVFDPSSPTRDRWWMKEPLSSALKNYAVEELEIEIAPYASAVQYHSTATASTIPQLPLELDAKQFCTSKMDKVRTGFIALSVVAHKPTRLIVRFDEYLDSETGEAIRMGAENLVLWDLQPGTYQLETIEPYSLQYFRTGVISGSCTIHRVAIREYANDEVSGHIPDLDPELQLVYTAALETFRQNAPDLYMDCPGRERAAWLCDSYFTAKAEWTFCHNNPVEHNFLENYALPEKFPRIEDGMLPMCYPSDHVNENYIPQWAMWFVIQLEDFALNRNGDPELVNRLRPRMFSLLAFIEKYRNSDGLLERLPKWNFVEWSKANELTKDINAPTNMLYVGVLEALDRLYDQPELAERAEKVRQFLRREAWDGAWFCDRWLRDEKGRAVRTSERTEVCQYFAFFFKIATPSTHHDLWQRLVRHFGSNRTGDCFPEIFPANMFIGFTMRLDLLIQHREFTSVFEECRGLFLHMARTTGTLWENKTTSHGSLNHGFAAVIGTYLTQAAEGLRMRS